MARISSYGYIKRGQALIILLLIPIGLLTTFMIPVGAGFDEEQHLWRTWEMSAFRYIPNSGLGLAMPVPKLFIDISYRQNKIIRPIEPGFWDAFGDLQIDSNGWVYDKAYTRSIYSPALLLPQSIVARYFWRKYDLPAIPVFFSLRIVGLLSYVFLAFIAVYFIPYGKWMLSVLVATPSALFQASTLSADPISTGIGLLFLGGSLAIVRVKEIGGKQWLCLASLISLLFLAKVNLSPLVLLPFLILRPSQFKSKIVYVGLILTACALFIVEVIGWQVLVMSIDTASPSVSKMFPKLLYLFNHIGSYVISLITDLTMNGLSYIQGWIAAYGYYYWRVPTPTYLLFGLALLLSFLLDSNLPLPSCRDRSVFIIVFVTGYLATAISLQLTAEPLGSTTAHELQGRYFAALMPLVLLSLLGPPMTKQHSIPSWLVVALTNATLVVYTLGLGLSYHIVCGTSLYSVGLCYQPQYKNWAPNQVFSPPITGDITIKQEFLVECDGLSQVRVWVDASDADSRSKTNFTIVKVEDQKQIFAKSIPNDGMPSNGWLNLSFPIESESESSIYTLLIQSPNDPVFLGPRFGYTILREYELGRLFENEDALDVDLFFQYGCKTGLIGIWENFTKGYLVR